MPIRSRSGPAGRRHGLVLAGVLLVLAGCTSATTPTPSGSGAPSSASIAPERTTVAPTPVTPDGMETGPGVTDTGITLGLLVDAARDRGFADGARLWAASVNAEGGICGRTVSYRGAPTTRPVSWDYQDMAGSVLGFLALPALADTAALAGLATADRIPVLEVTGSSVALRPNGPLLLGATDDVVIINALSYLIRQGRLTEGDTVGVVSDGSADGVNGLVGVRWWADRADSSLLVRTVAQASAAGQSWSGVQAVVVLAASTVTAAVLARTAGIPVVTNLDGYDAEQATDAAGRLLIALPTPAFGSPHPAAAAVATAAAAAGVAQPGARFLQGYAVASSWGRLLVQACSDRTLTRTGLAEAIKSVGPAPVDSLLGPCDPELSASGLPATRVSSVALADPSAPAGLKALGSLESAPDIADYRPG